MSSLGWEVYMDNKSKKLRIAIGSDDAGYDYKEILKADLEKDPRVDSVIDVGIQRGESTDYPHVAVAAARLVAKGKADRALLICGTGLGMAIADRPRRVLC
jgi:ribose 5-phosphate isomerase B